ncbi:hypothetical protein JOF56_009735 [Kibdelosporangium banguiense]|uniref:Uncharacterized protein n=1 Tax=Kibdelosporangium banguiense TaxID=1365924 RepID=A0ABS4TY65_9PSEU|nr:hypothetical protein [Kibdelosporangium banguiense]MBP2329350.1 hypothetical protein [Kibdelosporangium banguiense]
MLVQGGNGALHNNFELFVKIGMNHEHWYRENSDAKTPWLKVGVVRSVDPWRDCPAVVQSTFNRNFELVYRSTYHQLRHVYFDQSSGWWNDATIFGPVDPVGIPGFVQSDRGAPGDFEVVVVNQYGQAEHWTKHNSAPWTREPGEWYQRATFGADFAFGGPSLVQSRLGGGELHYVGTVTSGAMRHYRYGASGWTLENTFGDNASSAPCLIEGTYGAGNETGVGNFELCVAVSDRIEHWWRYNAVPGAWNLSAVFGAQVRRVVSLLQSTYGTNLELVAERTDGAYQHYWRDGGGWHTGPIVT